ncbi:MAG TPA: hypothetical protein VNX28_19785 [Gemmataceae bacterium]|jgi:hypothetical protein|nr:hypothetical protein [Gemmataceae bacterium]
MNAEKHFISFAIAVGLGALGPASAAWAQAGGYDYEYEGGYVKPCSLAGVNPAYHPEVFGNPATAREFGFARSPDGTWHTQNCPGGRDQAVTETGESVGQRAPYHHRTAQRKPHRKLAKSE